MADDTLKSWLQGDLKRTDYLQEPDDAPHGWWNNQTWDDHHERRRKAVWVLAVLPWLLVAGLMLGRDRAPAPTTAPPPSPADTQVAAITTPGRPPTPQAVPPHQPHPEHALDPALGAIAALAVQDALTHTEKATGRQRYVDLALPVAATWMGNVAIVRVAAIVLEGAQGQWEQPRYALYAVPIGAHPREANPNPGAFTVLGSPWALPDPPQTTPVTAALVPLQDHTRAETTAHALATAGYQDITIRSLGRDPAIAGVLHAEVQAIAPGETSSRSHTVWLHDDPTPTLLGVNESRSDHRGAGSE
jgi:hypothetical protein